MDLGCKIDAYDTFDIVSKDQFTGSFGLDGQSSITLDAFNAADEDQSVVAIELAFNETSQDPRGRLLYLRYKKN